MAEGFRDGAEGAALRGQLKLALPPRADILPSMKFTALLAALFLGVNLHAAPLRALIIDGQNNHDF